MANRHDLALVVVRLGGQAHGQRHRAHTSHKHHGHIQELCPILQPGGHAHRQTHRAKGRAGLEDGVNDRHRIRGVVVHHHSRAKGSQCADDNDGQGTVHRFGLNVVVGDHAVIPALRHAADGQEQHRKGGHLHAAARGTGCRTNELQHAHQQLGDGPAGRQINGVHTGRAGGHRLEQRRHDLIPCAEVSHAAGVVPLQQTDEGCTPYPQQHRKDQHHPSVEGQLALFGVLDQLHPHHKAQAACNDHKHDHGLDIVVVDIGHQGGIGPKLTKQVKACIAEGRNGGKDADPDALEPKLGHKGQHQQQDACPFKAGRQPHHDAQHVLGLRVAISRHALAQHSQVPEAHAPPHGQRKKAGQGHQTQASHLDQDQDHRLPEHRELGPGVPHDQTGHAGGAGGREHGVDHPHPPVAAGNGQ